MKREKYCLGILGLVVVLVLSIVLTMANKAIYSEEEKEPERINGVPLMRIELKDLSVDELNASDKTIKHGGNNADIIYADKAIRYNDVEIKTRGNSTWGLPKMSYQLKFNKAENLLGFPRTKKWVMLADHLDATQLRNDAAFYLARMLDDAFPLHGGFVELDINNEYLGTYYIVNKIAISKNMIDLRDKLGVIVEMDNMRPFEHECYYTSRSECLALTDIVESELESTAMEGFVSDFEKAEEAAASKDYKAVDDILDIESFAKYFLVSEFTVNPDAYSASYYMYRDGEKDKIHAGPVWDFDYAFGNKAWYWAAQDEFFSPYEDLVREKEARGGVIEHEGEQIEVEPNTSVSQLFYDLMDMPEFREVVKRIFNDRMSGRKEEYMQYINTRIQTISEALERNNERWGINNMDSELDYLLDWIEKRYLHFEEIYGNSDLDTQSPMT